MPASAGVRSWGTDWWDNIHQFIGKDTASHRIGHAPSERDRVRASGILRWLAPTDDPSATMTKQPNDSCRLTTSAGSIRLRVRKETAIDIDARANMGSVVGPVVATASKQKALKLQLNGGVPEVKHGSSVGSIRPEYIDNEQ